MKVRELLESFDAVRGNQLCDSVKLAWINDIEGKIQCELMKKRTDEFVLVKSDEDALSIPDAYSSIYILYLTAKLEFVQRNYDAYSSAMKEFEKEFHTYAKMCMRTR